MKIILGILFCLLFNEIAYSPKTKAAPNWHSVFNDPNGTVRSMEIDLNSANHLAEFKLVYFRHRLLLTNPFSGTADYKYVDNYLDCKNRLYVYLPSGKKGTPKPNDFDGYDVFGKFCTY